MAAIKSRTVKPGARLILIVFASLSLAGCASFSLDGGFGSVDRSARERLGKEVKWARTDKERALLKARVEELLTKPLGVEDAV